MAEVGSPRLRVVLGATLAILVHGAGLLALRPAAALPAVDAVAEARAARAALPRTAEGDVASGRATLGETLVSLEWLDRVEEDRHGDLAERDSALLIYRALLADVRAGSSRVVARLGDPGADVSPTLAGAGRLVALGEGGRAVMLLASERHRGFWELANLMTRPSSQVGAVARFRDRPVDVQLDVVDALPCASETFLAQLDTVQLPAARTLRAACEVRAHVDQDPCPLPAALARTRVRLAPSRRGPRSLRGRARAPPGGAPPRRGLEGQRPPVGRAEARVDRAGSRVADRDFE